MFNTTWNIATLLITIAKDTKVNLSCDTIAKSFYFL